MDAHLFLYSKDIEIQLVKRQEENGSNYYVLKFADFLQNKVYVYMDQEAFEKVKEDLKILLGDC